MEVIIDTIADDNLYGDIVETWQVALANVLSVLLLIFVRVLNIVNEECVSEAR